MREWALQSTSMPALHRRILPNCRPMAEGGMRKCSAVEDFARRGACPPLGPGRGPGTIRRELHSSAFPPAVNVVRGLVPRRGRGGVWQSPPCQFAVPSHNSSFSYLGVPAPAGTSDCYESMSRTTIRDRLLRQPLIRHSRHPFVNPAPHSSFRLSPESSGAGRGECSAGACPPLGPGRGLAQSAASFIRPHSPRQSM